MNQYNIFGEIDKVILNKETNNFEVKNMIKLKYHKDIIEEMEQLRKEGFKGEIRIIYEMKKVLIALILILGINNIQAQNYVKPLNPDKDNGFFGGVYTSLNLLDYVDFGGVAGVNLKDRFLLGGFYQKSISNNDFYGVYTQINLNPRQYYYTVGLALRTGLTNYGKVAIEPGVTIQSNIKDNIKIIHQIGITGSFVSYNIGVAFGNFGIKWWEDKKR